MIDDIYTQHAETRMQQRGIRRKDIRLILLFGTRIDEETWIMRKKDANREIASRKQEIKVLERLENRKVVISGGHVITAYPSRPVDQKRTLRRGRRKGLMK